jgi:hypothetical protein
MKEGLLERIRGIGHWRVNLRPLHPPSERLSFQQCEEVVRRNRVSIRGWDYPHVSSRQDDQGGLVRGDEFVEAWCEWHTQLEFWRMYRSGQFLSYNALGEDFLHGVQGRPDRPFLDVVDTTYSITEFVEFAHRLFITGTHSDGVEFDLSLYGSQRRALWTGGNRIPFFDVKQTEVETIRIKEMLTPTAWAKGPIEIANRILLELFDHFGWNPQAAQIRTDQEKFYRREFR